MSTPRSVFGIPADIGHRQQAGRWNRRLGYVMLPLLMFNTIVYYARHHDGVAVFTSSAWHVLSHAVLVGMFFMHVALSVYVFGWVRPRRSLRVFHIYFGYATFVIVMLSQTGLTDGRLRDLLTVLMYVAIAVHIVIGARFGVTRTTTQVPERRFAPAAERV